MRLQRWARDTPDAVAILDDAGSGAATAFTYGALLADANRLSNALGSLGVTRGDRVAVAMPQRPQTAVALMALFQMGAIAVPLSTLFGPEALQARLDDSGAEAGDRRRRLGRHDRGLARGVSRAGPRNPAGRPPLSS